MYTITIDGREITPETIIVEDVDGKPWIATAPLPEYVAVAPSFWDEALLYEAGTPDSPDRAWIWREAVGHADEDVANDGYLLHLDATNVTAVYRLLGEGDGNKVLRLESWSEH